MRWVWVIWFYNHYDKNKLPHIKLRLPRLWKLRYILIWKIEESVCLWVWRVCQISNFIGELIWNAFLYASESVNVDFQPFGLLSSNTCMLRCCLQQIVAKRLPGIGSRTKRSQAHEEKFHFDEWKVWRIAGKWIKWSPHVNRCSSQRRGRWMSVVIFRDLMKSTSARRPR